MDRVKKLIHAEEEEVFPYTGSGVTVAILDTGIAMHPDFADRVIGFRDFVGTSRMPYDDCGHGTHVAGCLCGNGACSGGLYAGVAPGCRILSGKVLDDKGDGTISNMAAGIEWAMPRIVGVSRGVGGGAVAAVAEREDHPGGPDDVEGAVEHVVPGRADHPPVLFEELRDHHVVEHVRAH